MKKKAIIISIKGLRLTTKEKNLIKKEKPWGLILFKRNIRSLNQVQKLIQEIKKSSNDKKFPIMVDEEGGKVSRLENIVRHKITQKMIGDIFKISPSITLKIYKEYTNSICSILKKIGININTVPVLDVLQNKTHKIIGNRSFSKNALVVRKLGEACIKYYKINKIGNVIKHIPGHGCAKSDSHLKTPQVKDKYDKLLKSDFFPFKSISSHFAMTAHVLYKNIDNENVATFSSKIIKNIIRKKLGFRGIIISDDISMKALKFDLITNAKKSLLAGCNLVLYCSGNYKDSLKLIKSVPYIDTFTRKKTSEFYKFLG